MLEKSNEKYIRYSDELRGWGGRGKPFVYYSETDKPVRVELSNDVPVKIKTENLVKYKRIESVEDINKQTYNETNIKKKRYIDDDNYFTPDVSPEVPYRYMHVRVYDFFSSIIKFLILLSGIIIKILKISLKALATTSATILTIIAFNNIRCWFKWRFPKLKKNKRNA